MNPSGVKRTCLGLGLMLSFSASTHALESVPATALGRSVFSEKCAKCHDVDASRPLADGRSLVDRLRPKPDLAAALMGRIKDLPEEKRLAVVAYVQSLIDKAPTREAAPAPKKP
jgi:mono/diheme cytochrome c family protein